MKKVERQLTVQGTGAGGGGEGEETAENEREVLKNLKQRKSIKKLETHVFFQLSDTRNHLIFHHPPEVFSIFSQKQ